MMAETKKFDYPEASDSGPGISVTSTRSFYDWAAIALLVVAFVYTCIRAYSLSITHDEAITYNVHASGSFYDIFTYALPVKSNNHLLNSILTKVICGLSGVSEFVMRIPPLIGHVLYLVGIYRILKLFLKRHLLLLGTCLMISHPFMIDMFSCARGYSLGLGFLVIALYYCFKRVEQSGAKGDVKNTAMASIMMTMSVFSNLSFLNAFIGVVIILFILQLRQIVALAGKKRSVIIIFNKLIKNVILPIFTCIFILALIYVNPVILMLREDEFWWGGFDGIWKNTVTSLIETSIYGRDYVNFGIISWAKLIIFSLLFISLSIVMYDIFKRKKTIMDRYLILVLSILAVICFSISLEHFLIGIRYPIDRTAIYFIPIFLLFILILWKRIGLIENAIIRSILNPIMYLLIIPIIFHFIFCSNITHYYSWKYDAATKDMINYIIDENRGKELDTNSIRMGIDWIFEPSINFYIMKNNMEWMKKVDRKGPNSMNDYYYLQVPYIKLLSKYNLKIVKYFKISETYLAKPENPGSSTALPGFEGSGPAGG